VLLLAQYVYVKGIQAKTPWEEDMGVPCMDKACLGAVLVSRTRDGISKDAVVSVDVVDVGGLRGRALRERLGNGHDEATRLRHDKRSETQGLGTGWALHIPKTAAGCGGRCEYAEG
jgi:hypothetical protein